MRNAVTAAVQPSSRPRKRLQKDHIRLYLLFLPVAVWYMIFQYVPMGGLVIAFQDFKILKGIGASKFVGFDNFVYLFSLPSFLQAIRNTLIMAVQRLVFSFPLPILFALLLNEVQSPRLKKTAQTISYLPHFISWSVAGGLVYMLLSPNTGVVNNVIKMLGGTPKNFLGQSQYFYNIVLFSGMWKNLGWGSIVYLAALSSISVDIYEAARIDGASRMQRIIYINLPHLLPTICTLFILNTGKVMSLGFEKVFLMQNPLNIDTSEIISTYIYKKGILNAQYSFSTAVGLFNSVINLFLVLVVNGISRKINETSIW